MATPLILGQYEQGPDVAIAGVRDAEGDDPARVLDHPTMASLLDGAPHILLRDLPWRQEVLSHSESNVEHRLDVLERGDAHRVSWVIGHGSRNFAVNDGFDPRAREKFPEPRTRPGPHAQGPTSWNLCDWAEGEEAKLARCTTSAAALLFER